MATNPKELRQQLRSAQWGYEDAKYMGARELINFHRQLHDQFGETNYEAVLDIEQEAAAELRQMGIEHRYADALSDAAGTTEESPKDPTLDELRYYLDQVSMDSGAVRFVRDAAGGPIYVDVRSPLLKGMESSILKALNRVMPPGVTLKSVSKGMKGDFAETLNIYDLVLHPERAYYSSVQVTVWEAVTARLRTSAAAASSVFKENVDPTVPFKMASVWLEKAAEDAEEGETADNAPVTVTGVVLEPEIIDGTVSKDDQGVSEGDIYSSIEIYKAMTWWMENGSSAFSNLHILKGGSALSGTEVVLHECWQTRQKEMHGSQEVPEGTWMMTTKVNDPDLAADIRAGKINSWSVGIKAMAAKECVQVTV